LPHASVAAALHKHTDVRPGQRDTVKGINQRAHRRGAPQHQRHGVHDCIRARVRVSVAVPPPESADVKSADTHTDTHRHPRL
jgi:hypothetical protein